MRDVNNIRRPRSRPPVWLVLALLLTRVGDESHLLHLNGANKCRQKSWKPKIRPPLLPSVPLAFPYYYYYYYSRRALASFSPPSQSATTTTTATASRTREASKKFRVKFWVGAPPSPRGRRGAGDAGKESTQLLIGPLPAPPPVRNQVQENA